MSWTFAVILSSICINTTQVRQHGKIADLVSLIINSSYNQLIILPRFHTRYISFVGGFTDRQWDNINGQCYSENVSSHSTLNVILQTLKQAVKH